MVDETELIKKVSTQGNRKPKTITRKITPKTTWAMLEKREELQAKSLEGSPSKLQVRELLLIQYMLRNGFSQNKIITEINALREINQSHIGCSSFDEVTWNNWKVNYSEFFRHIARSREEVVAQAYQSLQDLSKPGELWEEKAMPRLTGDGTSEIEIVKIRKEVPANFNAVKFVLTNLDSERFSDKKTIEMPDLAHLTDEDLRSELNKSMEGHNISTDEKKSISDETGES